MDIIILKRTTSHIRLITGELGRYDSTLPARPAQMETLGRLVRSSSILKVSSWIFTHLATQQPARSPESKFTHPSPT
jgi:hypothetical protein